MTLAGLTLAIGPMIDSAIICLENTHRHLTLGAKPQQAALDGASEVAMPELVSTLCTFLVLVAAGPDARHGPISVPAHDAGGDVRHDHGLSPVAHAGPLRQRLSAVAPRSRSRTRAAGSLAGLFARWERLDRPRHRALRPRFWTWSCGTGSRPSSSAFALLAVTLVVLDARPAARLLSGSRFRAPSRSPSALPAARASKTPKSWSTKVEKFVRDHIPEEDLELIVSEIGLTADWSAAYTANAGPMDAIVKVQLTPERRAFLAGVHSHPARKGWRRTPRFDSPGVLLRFRRPDARRLERRQIVAASTFSSSARTRRRPVRARRPDQEGGAEASPASSMPASCKSRTPRS